MSEWSIKLCDQGGHVVHHHDHETDERTLVGSFGAKIALGDLVALLKERVLDGDYILLLDGSPVIILDVPDRAALPMTTAAL
jgi:hypothetical protein